MAIGVLQSTVLLIHLLSSFAATAQAPKKYALLIGLNGYSRTTEMGGIPSLNWAINDVKALQKALLARGYDDVHRLIYSPKDGDDQPVTRANILKKLAYFANNLTEKDTFILYFAGHGVRMKGPPERTYWLTYESDLLLPDVDGIRLSHLWDYVRDIKATRKLVLLDHCFAGDIVDAGGGGSSSVRGETTSSSSPRALSRDSRPLDESSLRGAVPSGIAMIAAARGSAYERDDLGGGHGLFTYYLLQALTTHDADKSPKNGALSLPELFEYVRAKVREGSGDSQVPVEQMSGVDLTRWLIADTLPAEAPTVVEEADSCKEKLTDWKERELLKPEERSRCLASIRAWVESITKATLLPERDRKIMKAVREAVSCSKAGEVGEATCVEALRDDLKAATAPPPAT